MNDLRTKNEPVLYDFGSGQHAYFFPRTGTLGAFTIVTGNHQHAKRCPGQAGTVWVVATTARPGRTCLAAPRTGLS